MACPLSGEGSGESDPGGCGQLASVTDGPGVEADGGVLRANDRSSGCRVNLEQGGKTPRQTLVTWATVFQLLLKL